MKEKRIQNLLTKGLFAFLFVLMGALSLQAQNCDDAQGTPGFACDPACEAAVCAIDPFCCSVSWDGLCAGEAATNAACVNCLTANGGCGGPPPPPPVGCETFPGSAGAISGIGTFNFTADVAVACTAGDVIGTNVTLDNVTIVDLDHTFDGDLDITLIAPGGAPSLLLSDQNGGAGDDYTNTVFQDGGNDINTAAPPFTGTFEPEGGTFAAAFNGVNANGQWTLEIVDNFAGDTGNLNAWEITFCELSCDDVVICDPPTVVCPPDMTVQCEADIMVDAMDATATADVANGCSIVGQWVTEPRIEGARDCDGTTYTYTYKAVDEQGNIGTCDQVWTLQNDPPTITVIPGGTVECAADIETDPSDATVTTSCGDPEDLEVTIYTPVITGTPNCPNTTYTYTYRIEDQCEREATADRVFTVQNAGPSIVAPDDVTCECWGGVNTNPDNANVDASCDLGYAASSSVVFNGTQDCPGSTAVVTYTATDDCGRTVSDNQVYTIQNGPPTLDGHDNCLIISCDDEGWEDIIQAWLNAVTAKNSCGTPINVSNNYNPNAQGHCISNGTTTVTWFATDQCGRTSTITNMIIIADTEPPHFIEEAQDVLDICNYNTPHDFDDWVDAHGGAIAYDGCDENITNNQWSTIPNNPSFPNCMGQMGPVSVTVTFVVRDDCGNKSSTTATYTALMAGGDLVDGSNGEADASHVFELYQNQPNPFKHETVIGFSLPEAGSATLTVYDVSGKVVNVVQGDYSAGYNQVQINRNDLSSAGMLYYQLSTADDTAVRKMIITD